MTRTRLRLQIGALALLVVAVIASLVFAAQQGRTVREAAYDVNGIYGVVRLVDGGQVCETPVQVDGEFQRLVFWSSGLNSKALVSVHQGESPIAPTVALGILESGSLMPGENVVTLTQPVAARHDLTVCVEAKRGAVTLFGGQSSYLSNSSGPPYGAPVIIGFQPESTLWLQAWSAKPHGLWDSLALAFRRMSLFRLSWVGTWTFWVLLIGVFAGFPLLVLAVWLALKAEEENRDEPSPR